MGRQCQIQAKLPQWQKIRLAMGALKIEDIARAAQPNSKFLVV